MRDDLVQRLRTHMAVPDIWKLRWEAADRIEALEADAAHRAERLAAFVSHVVQSRRSLRADMAEADANHGKLYAALGAESRARLEAEQALADQLAVVLEGLERYYQPEGARPNSPLGVALAAWRTARKVDQ